MTASERKNKSHDMGGQPGGPIPIDPPEGPVFAEDWQARALAITVAAGGWAGIWTALVMPVNACRLQIIRPTAIMKNGWPGWRPCWWKQGWFQQTSSARASALPRCGPGPRSQPPQLKRLPLLPVAGRLCVLTGPHRALPLASGSQFLTRIRWPVAQTAIPACRPIVRAVQARSSAITTAMFCLTAMHMG